MRIRHLKIRIETDQGPHGTELSFPDGLVVFRADNTAGKSTCMQSIFVALGLEAMLTVKRRDLPLQPVMVNELHSDQLGKIARVIESNIYLEIENRNNERIVVSRTVKGSTNKNLIRVSFGPALSEPMGSYISRDYFVSQPGAATRERGFHFFLAQFLGWDLPSVTTYEGREVPLYIETIFPYFAVEQKRGWSTLSPPLPTQFRIREPQKRALEFLLDLDARKIAEKRIELATRIREIEIRWSAIKAELKASADAVGGIPKSVPQKPVVEWPPTPEPIIQVPVDETRWTTLEDHIKSERSRLLEMNSSEIPLVSSSISSSNAELNEVTKRLQDNEVILSRYINLMQLDRSEVAAIETRLRSLVEDIQRNKDVRTLQKLGSSITQHVSENRCPTCQQEIEDSLLPAEAAEQTMSIEDNIEFLEQQHKTFAAALKNAELVVAARESQLQHLQEKISSDRAKIRTIRTTLISDERLPSIERIREKLELEQSIVIKESRLEQFQILLQRMEPLCNEWLTVQSELNNLPKVDVSSEDREKLDAWVKSVRAQLQEYDFRSLRIDEIDISTDTFVPIHEGFDLSTNISASDFIRIIWAYLTGLLEVSRTFQTNHPGLMIFDEPRQQSAKDVSFAALLKRASESSRYGQQVIFATSEQHQILMDILESVPHTYIGIQDQIIKPLSGS